MITNPLRSFRCSVCGIGVPKSLLPHSKFTERMSWLRSHYRVHHPVEFRGWYKNPSLKAIGEVANPLPIIAPLAEGAVAGAGIATGWKTVDWLHSKFTKKKNPTKVAEVTRKVNPLYRVSYKLFGREESISFYAKDAEEAIAKAKKTLVRGLPTTDWRSILEKKNPISMVCLECGRRFRRRKGLRVWEVKCLRCGSYDVMVDYGPIKRGR